MREFVDESREHIVALNRDLLELEERGAAADPEIVNSVFRAVHTVKGLSGMLGLSSINELSHSMEDALATVREGEAVVSGPLAEALFESLDSLSEMVEAAARGGEAERDPGKAMGRLSAAAEEARRKGSRSDGRAPTGSAGEPHGESAPAGEEDAALLKIAHSNSALFNAGPLEAGSLKTRTPRSPAQPVVAGSADSTSGAGLPMSQAIRVDVAKLDRILSLVGELVIVRSRYNHLAGEALRELADATGTSRRATSLQSDLNEIESSMSRTLNELQDAVMKARLVPLGTVFGRFRRAVRDMASHADKRVRFDSSGGETELDKKMIDQIGDPLMHLIRNAVDHGIEMPEERTREGKLGTGRVTLSARQEGDRIVVEVADDGRGLDSRQILRKAVERGMISPEKAAEAAAETGLDQVQNIISTPGFTTSAAVTAVSGRGVGMDVVNQALADLKGTLEVESSPGEGTTFRMKLPLTMAIVDALLVSAGGESYALAVSSVREILEVHDESIYCVGGRECLHVGERVLPLVRLARALGGHERAPLASPGGDAASPGADTSSLRARNGGLTTVVVDSGEGEVGLAVDRVVGQQEIVIKALSRRFENVVEISGGSVLGDGSVCLILDVPSLVAKVNEEYAGVELTR